MNNVTGKHLRAIANQLDEHIKLGMPYSLTFFHDKRIPLTDEQKKIIEEYLAYHFRDIWGKTWICGEAKQIRAIVKYPNGKWMDYRPGKWTFNEEGK